MLDELTALTRAPNCMVGGEIVAPSSRIPPRFSVPGPRIHIMWAVSHAFSFLE